MDIVRRHPVHKGASWLRRWSGRPVMAEPAVLQPPPPDRVEVSWIKTQKPSLLLLRWLTHIQCVNERHTCKVLWIKALRCTQFTIQSLFIPGSNKQDLNSNFHIVVSDSVKKIWENLLFLLYHYCALGGSFSDSCHDLVWPTKLLFFRLVQVWMTYNKSTAKTVIDPS